MSPNSILFPFPLFFQTLFRIVYDAHQHLYTFGSPLRSNKILKIIKKKNTNKHKQLPHLEIKKFVRKEKVIKNGADIKTNRLLLLQTSPHIM